MKLHTMGIDFHHDSDFLIDRPDGSGDDLLLIFKTPAKVRINGELQSVPADSAVLFSGGYPQYYGADGGEYINHWVHFEIGSDASFLQRIGLSFNTIVAVNDIRAAEDTLNLLNIESVSGGANHAECTDLLLRLLLARLGGSRQSIADSHHSTALRELRAGIYRTPSEHRTIEGLASQLMLSPSHFQYLYKQEFGVSCYEDIITARINRACYYLRNTSLPIMRIAELCGYENDVHFIRQFKKRMGMTAGQYRNN